MITLIAAVAKNGVIGKGNDIPWKLKSDFQHFKSYTMGKIIVMGRRTWDSLPVKPLKGRINIVVSASLNPVDILPAYVARSLDEALTVGKNTLNGPSEIVIIGGGQLYREALDKNIIDKIILSEIDTDAEGDVFFPSIDMKIYNEISRVAVREDILSYDIVTYTRTR